MLVKLENQRQKTQNKDRENLLYYQGKQYIRFLGLRLRQEWLTQAFPLSWCKTLVRVTVQRQQVARLRALAEESGLDPIFAEKFFAFIVAEVIQHHEEIRDGHEAELAR